MEEEIENNSGQGKETIVPNAVAKHFNWGAFFFTWIWGIFNNSWITLIALGLSIFSFILGIFSGMVNIGSLSLLLAPVTWIASLVLKIWFGIKGNSWAWQNKKWDSAERFHNVQKIWAIVGLVLCVLTFFFGVMMGLLLPPLISKTHSAMINSATKKQKAVITQAITINEALNEKCKKDSAGLAECFANRLNVTKQDNNVIQLSDNSVYEFTGDGLCKDNYSCYAVIYPIGKKFNPRKPDYHFSIYFRTNKSGHLKIVE